MEYHDLHISSFDEWNGIATSARRTNLSNKGGMVQFNQERMIVLNPAKHLTLNRIFLFQSSFFTIIPEHF